MQDKLEKLIKMVYKNWKLKKIGLPSSHPDEQDCACFFEGKLSAEETVSFKEHLLHCDACAEAISTQIRLNELKESEIPGEIIENSKKMVADYLGVDLLEILLKFAGKAIEIINTTGDLLVGQELIPAPVLRSRSINEFRDEVTILKDFTDIRVEIKIENRNNNIFDVTISVKDKKTQIQIKDLRITLISKGLELESYSSETGKVIFEHIALGRYAIEITSSEEKLGTVIIDVKL
jgi:hypothetical protein